MPITQFVLQFYLLSCHVLDRCISHSICTAIYVVAAVVNGNDRSNQCRHNTLPVQISTAVFVYVDCHINMLVDYDISYRMQADRLVVFVSFTF